MERYHFSPGDQPLLVSIPHVGEYVPESLRDQWTEAAQHLPDTDWHLDRLYNWLEEEGIGVIAATFSRYVIDLNRPPDDTPLYTSATTSLCPTQCFDGSPIYREGREPDFGTQQQRLQDYWQPYHQRLMLELQRIQHRFGFAVLCDLHSIRSEVPRLFPGILPDLNIGTHDGASASDDLVKRLMAVCADAYPYTSVLNGRFKGGYITRHYGNPEAHIHAIQIELSQRTYMDEDPPFTFQETLAGTIRPTLRRLLEEMRTWREY